MTPAEFEIRRYLESDGPKVAALVVRSVDEGFRGHYDSTISARVANDYRPRSLDRLSTDSDLRVVCQGNRPVAVGGLRSDWIHGVFVDPSFQRMGLGRALIGRLLSDAGSRGMNRVRLHAVLGSEPFYRKLGFELAKAFEHPRYGHLTEMFRHVP